MVALLWPLWLLLVSSVTVAQQDYSCSLSMPCREGCCSKDGSCGFGPGYCDEGCQGNCDAKAECGPYGTVADCPLNVCCSKYGFCGTTSEFCGDGCTKGCQKYSIPSCPASTDVSNLRRIGYYSIGSLSRSCDRMFPDEVPAGALTHINIAFVQFTDKYELDDFISFDAGPIVTGIAALKDTNPGLRISVSVGGWDFNDGATATYFSDMASTSGNRQTFITSVVNYIIKYGLDGLDLDWEYPVAPDRSGKPEDKENYVKLVQELHDTFSNYGWDLTVTLPCSYWYMKDFHIVAMEKYVSWFNVMSYDMNGLWNADSRYIGSYLLGLTNLTEIEQGFDLLWRNNISPSKVVMGMAFYGRSYTMANGDCAGTNCHFTGAGDAGDCSATPGILIYPELVGLNQTGDANTYYDEQSATVYTVYEGDQWVSYDNARSWQAKLEYLNSHCISGLMIWSIDDDTNDYTALTALLGEDAMAGSLLSGGDLTYQQRQQRANELSAFTGQNCFVTEVCTDGSSGQSGPGQVCPSGTVSITTAHSPLQAPNHKLRGACSKGWYRHICCPQNEAPTGCDWTDCESSTCKGNSTFELNRDLFSDAKGDSSCGGKTSRKLCCDGSALLSQCIWTGCQHHPDQGAATCPSGYKFMTERHDNGNGELCAKEMKDKHPSEMSLLYSQAFCCPNNDVPKNCSWTFDRNTPFNQFTLYDPKAMCDPEPCPKGQVQYTTALDPDNPAIGTPGSLGSTNCALYPIPAGENPNFKYCCNPPDPYNEKWPVPPKDLWAVAYSSQGSDVDWAYSDDGLGLGSDAKYGADPYGFLMLDGPPGSIDSTFHNTYNVIRADDASQSRRSFTKRSFVTRNETVMGTNFEHAEEVLCIYCQFSSNSPRCQRLFHNGAVDTIIHLPPHVGEGPFARVVSIELVDDSYRLPAHHESKREAQANDNPVYKMLIDYNFNQIQDDRKKPINMRVDFTNLEKYWSTVDDSSPSSKRSVSSEHTSYEEWRRNVNAATHQRDHERNLLKQVVKGNQSSFNSLPLESENFPSVHRKRWFGALKNWLKKVTKIERSNHQELAMDYEASILLYHKSKGCEKAKAEMSIYLDTSLDMVADYAYYFSGTLVPPKVTDTYAYFGMQPDLYLGVTVQGSASLKYASARKPLIPTITYPGLAIKGLAVVGPTFDLYGQIVGKVTLSGDMTIGAQYTFERSEMYWPQDSTTNVFDKIGDSAKPEPLEAGLHPQFDASVRADAQLDFKVTPEANIGIQVGGKNFISGASLVDARLSAFINNTLRFSAKVSGTASVGKSGGSAVAKYSYGAYLLYNVGFGGHANILGYGWNMVNKYLFSSPKQYELFSSGDVASVDYRKRSLPQRAFVNSDTIFGGKNVAQSGEELAEMRVIGVDGNLAWSTTQMHLVNRSESIDHRKILKRQNPVDSGGDDTEDTDMGGSGCFSSGVLSCPANSCSDGGDGTGSVSCQPQLPALRFSCPFYSNSQVNGKKGQAIVSGICENMQTFLNQRQADLETGVTLTWRRNKKAAQKNRNAACYDKSLFPAGSKDSYCQANNKELKKSLGTKLSITSCDEFPPASVEEGGSFFPSLPQGEKANTAISCTPVWQQNMQSNCVQLMSALSTNFNYGDDPEGDPSWVSWSLKGSWYTESEWNKPIRYPYMVPLVQGINKEEYFKDDSRNLGWSQRRSFTFGLANPNPSSSSTWDSWWASDGSWSFVDSEKYGGDTHSDAAQIVCAVNLFDQDKVYKTSFNGFCAYRRAQTALGKLADFPEIHRCQIDFDNEENGSQGTNTKRSTNSTERRFAGWRVKKVTMLEDPDPKDAIIAPDFVFSGGKMPVEFVKEW